MTEEPPLEARSRLVDASKLVGVAVVYFAAAKLGLSLAFATRQVSAVWPPSGVALVAYALFGYRVWPAVFTAAFFANATQDEPLATAAGIAVGNTLSGVVGLSLARRLGDFRQSLDRVRDVMALAVFGAALGSVVSATNGVLQLALAGLIARSSFGSVWLVWWTGDTLGVLVIAPLLLTWFANWRFEWRGRARVELALLFLGIFVIGGFVFAGSFTEDAKVASVKYLAFPFLIWAGLRFGPRETSTTAVLLTVFAVWGASHGRGPFMSGALDQRLIQLDTFVAVIGMTALLIGAVTSERRQAFDALVLRDAELETRVEERTAELKAALAERGVLLAEIHHRVKNNLQVISSLINMQMRKLADAGSKDALEECQTRIQAIALIHEKLYQSEDYARVPFSEYAESLATSVFATARRPSDEIELHLDIEDVALGVDKAIPCGLMLNELITNAVKHGFPGEHRGSIWVRLERTSRERLCLSVSDDGVGIPPGFDAKTSGSLGHKLLTIFAEQLDGELVVTKRGTVTAFEICFPLR